VRPDRGFTLIEVVIVLATIGIIAAALAATVTVVLRTAPPTEERANDARSLQGLVTWIPQDVDAAPPSGFDTDAAAWPCGGPAPANSYNVLAVSWNERTTTTTNYASTYRYEFDGTNWHIARYACDDADTGTMTTGGRTNLTSALPPWDNLAPPASVTMCDTTVDNAGDCPAGHEILTNTSPDVESLKIRITRLDGVESTIDAAPKNPDQDLADDPNATTNAIPTISQTNYTLTMNAGDTVTLDLNTTHSPSDGDGDTLSVAIDSSEPMPAGITASTSDPLEVTITADPSLSSGTISPPVVLIISDPFAGWVDATVTVEILPAVNLPPTVSPTTYHALLPVGGATVVLPLELTHGATDPNGDPLAATVLNWPASTVHQPYIPPSDPMELGIAAKSATPVGVIPFPVEVLIEDGRGGSVTAFITLEVVAPAPNSPPTVTSGNVNLTMFADETVTLFVDASHGASDPDGDAIHVIVDPSDPQPAGITTVVPGGLEVQLTTDPSVTAGPMSVPVNLAVEDIQGNRTPITISVEILPTPPPPSDCVLGTIAASPNPVARQGNGSGPRHLKQDVTVTVTYSGSCDGLVLKYDTGDTSGLGVGTGRVFPPGSPSSIVIYSKGNGGTEKWLTGSFTLTASTTSAVTPSEISTTLTVN
jgi:prepilin-type N-terminal cleavage/methylation domain-containing protein